MKNWLVSVVAPYSEVVESARRIAFINLLLFLAGSALFIIFVYVIVRAISRSLRSVVEGLIREHRAGWPLLPSRFRPSSQQFAEGASEQAASIRGDILVP